MDSTIKFIWKKKAQQASYDRPSYEAIYVDGGRAYIILTAVKSMLGPYWVWNASMRHDHDDLQEFVEYRLTARTLADAKQHAEATVHRLIRAMQALHGSFDDA